jgi:transposase-like protein
MVKYCKKDVRLTEKVYKVLRGFSRSVPNYNTFHLDYSGGKPVCPKCGSTRMGKKGFRRTVTTVYQRLLCKDCGGWSRTDARGQMPRSI